MAFYDACGWARKGVTNLSGIRPTPMRGPDSREGAWLSSQVQATAAAAFSFFARTGGFLRGSGLCPTGFTIMSINAFWAST